jgi:uncharacterized membrane protein
MRSKILTLKIMRFINRKVHALLDYMSGLLLIASPWLFNFEEVSSARWVAIIVGVMILLISINTDYEGGITKMVTMATHLKMDVIAGLFLAVSPWILGFSDQVFLPHLILGIMEMGAGIFTEQKSEHPNARHVDDLRHAHK